MERILKSEVETEAFGAALLRCVPKKYLIFLRGQLGAGKTTLVRGFLRAAGYQGNVKSPTYTLVEEYQCAERKLIHFDLYRVVDPEELELIGFRDYFEQKAVCFIEWPEMGAGFLPEADMTIDLTIVPEGRLLRLENAPEGLKKELFGPWKNNNLLL